jgi:hypothetical protein
LASAGFLEPLVMTDNLDDIEGVAPEIIERFGTKAAHVVSIRNT